MFSICEILDLASCVELVASVMSVGKFDFRLKDEGTYGEIVVAEGVKNGDL